MHFIEVVIPRELTAVTESMDVRTILGFSLTTSMPISPRPKRWSAQGSRVRRLSLPEDGPSAFVSYSREDEGFAMKLAGDLKDANIKVWIDQSELKGGDPWNGEIEKALDACPRTLVVLSPASVRSRNVLNEVGRALRKQNTVIPVLYLDCDIPLQLECSHQVDFRSDYDRGLRASNKTCSHIGINQVPREAPGGSRISKKVSRSPNSICRGASRSLFPLLTFD